jgi:tyrosine-protein phosphatase YwqE
MESSSKGVWKVMGVFSNIHAMYASDNSIEEVAEYLMKVNRTLSKPEAIALATKYWREVQWSK